MNLKLSNIRISNEIETIENYVQGKSETLIVSICANNDTEEGSLDVIFEVEIRDFRNMTFAEIESLAVSRASTLLRQDN